MRKRRRVPSSGRPVSAEHPDSGRGHGSDCAATALAIGVGRAGLGLGILAAPVPGLRAMGMDSATAKRATWLGRLAAIRDLALGLGTIVATVRRREPGPWLLAGAGADLGDAVALGVAVRAGQLRAVPAVPIAGGAVLSAALAVRAAVGLRASRRSD